MKLLALTLALLAFGIAQATPGAGWVDAPILSAAQDPLPTCHASHATALSVIISPGDDLALAVAFHTAGAAPGTILRAFSGSDSAARAAESGLRVIVAPHPPTVAWASLVLGECLQGQGIAHDL